MPTKHAVIRAGSRLGAARPRRTRAAPTAFLVRQPGEGVPGPDAGQVAFDLPAPHRRCPCGAPPSPPRVSLPIEGEAEDGGEAVGQSKHGQGVDARGQGIAHVQVLRNQLAIAQLEPGLESGCQECMPSLLPRRES